MNGAFRYLRRNPSLAVGIALLAALGLFVIIGNLLVDAEDALIAALKAKTEHPEAQVMYVRRANKRGDARNPPHDLKK